MIGPFTFIQYDMKIGRHGFKTVSGQVKKKRTFISRESINPDYSHLASPCFKPVLKTVCKTEQCQRT